MPIERCKQALLEMGFTLGKIDDLFKNNPEIVTVEDALNHLEMSSSHSDSDVTIEVDFNRNN